MSNKTFTLSDDLHRYLLSVLPDEPDVMRRLRVETARDPKHSMQIAPEQGQFMQLLVKMIGARTALEIGVYTGYSALATALALPPDGMIVACDVSREWTDVGRRYWKEKRQVWSRRST
jgi:caffeoyl-CoA O-methyltransferase